MYVFIVATQCWNFEHSLMHGDCRGRDNGHKAPYARYHDHHHDTWLHSVGLPGADQRRVELRLTPACVW